MLKRNQGFRKLVWGRLLSFLLVLAVVITPFSASFAGKAYADNDEALTVSAAASEDNEDIVLTFNKPVTLLNENLIEYKGTYDGYFYDDFCSEPDVNGVTVTLHLDSNLSGDSNQIRIKAGAFEDQTSDIISNVFAAHDLGTPEDVSTAISSDRKDVTVTFNGNVQSVAQYVYEAIDYKIGRGSYTPLTALNEVELTGNTLTIHFPEGISGKTTIRIAEGAVQFVGGNLKTNASDLCIRLNANPIEFEDGYDLSDRLLIKNSVLQLYLSQDAINTGNPDTLRAAITISKEIEGQFGAYIALDSRDIVSIDNEGCSNINIHFFGSLTPGKYKVKIAAGTLKNISGLVTGEIISDEVEVNDHNSPVYQGVSVNGDRNVVTLTFDENLHENNMDLRTISSQLVYKTKISRSGNYFYDLEEGDTVVIVDKTLVITLITPLTGSQNKIRIMPGAISDEFGNYNQFSVVTQFIDVSAASAPIYDHSELSNLNRDWTLYFDKNVKNAALGTPEAALAALKNAITVSLNNAEPQAIDPSTTIEFIDNKLVLHFANPFVDPNISIYIAANAIADTGSNVLTTGIETESIDPHDFKEPEFNQAYLVTNHTAVLEFNLDNCNYTLENNTLDATILKSKVTYSTNYGQTFSALGANDTVYVRNNSLYVYFANVIQGNLQIKVAVDTLKDSVGNVLTSETVTHDIVTNLFNKPTLVGSYFSNVPSVFTFEDNAEWRSKIQKVVLYDYSYNNVRSLSPNEYSTSAGKLTIAKGVFEENSNYYLIVFADGYYTTVLNNLTAIKSQDSYYITPVTLDKTSGIEATVKVASHQSNGPLSVVFQLMNGQAAGSIVVGKYEFLGDEYGDKGTFKANFNVSDFATNPNYTVRAFIVSEYSNSLLSVGANLATQITEAEFDLVRNMPR